MFYIHDISCISAQQTFSAVALDVVKEAVDNKLYALETNDHNIPLNLLRRMGKAVRTGIMAGLPLIQKSTVDGIIIGTANGGLEDSIKFLNQIIDYEEGSLTPTNFVQSTSNAIAAQLGIMTSNKGYNSTHVHRGLAFEHAMTDAEMLLKENPAHTYLLGGVDEISAYDYNIQNLGGWYKKEIINSNALYTSASHGSIAGEGAAMFIVSNNKTNATAAVKAIKTFHTKDAGAVKEQMALFLKENLQADENIDILLSGENGDDRMQPFYNACETLLPEAATIARFKHMFGEFQTVSALAVWLTCHIIQAGKILPHMIKKSGHTALNTFLIYNTYRGNQHSFMLIDKVETAKF